MSSARSLASNSASGFRFARILTSLRACGLQPGDSVIYANPSQTMGAAFSFTNNTVELNSNATLLRLDLLRANSSN